MEEQKPQSSPCPAPTDHTIETELNSYSGKYALIGLFIMALIIFLKYMHIVILPIVIAVLLNFILAPAIHALKKIWIPPQLSAMLVIFIFLCSVGSIIYGLSGPTNKWLNQAPHALTQAKRKSC